MNFSIQNILIWKVYIQYLNESTMHTGCSHAFKLITPIWHCLNVFHMFHSVKWQHFAMVWISFLVMLGFRCKLCYCILIARLCCGLSDICLWEIMTARDWRTMRTDCCPLSCTTWSPTCLWWRYTQTLTLIPSNILESIRILVNSLG